MTASQVPDPPRETAAVPPEPVPVAPVQPATAPVVGGEARVEEERARAAQQRARADEARAQAERDRQGAMVRADEERVTARQREAAAIEGRRSALRRFRGLNLGAAFFGWLAGVGIAVLLTAVVAAAGAALSLTQEVANTSNLTTLSVGGVIILAIILLISYYSAGYVAGRLSRFSGAAQGIGVWVIGVIITAGLAIAGVIAGSKYNVLSQLRLPSIPVNGQSFATGGAIALAAMAVLTLLAAIAGGLTGLRYHHRVDRALSETAPPV